MLEVLSDQPCSGGSLLDALSSRVEPAELGALRQQLADVVRRLEAAGLVVRDLPMLASNWRSAQSLDAYLAENGIVAIADIDTRKLTGILREKGAQNGCIVAFTVSPELLAAMKAGLQAQIRFHDSKRQAIGVPVSRASSTIAGTSTERLGAPLA